MEEVRRRLVGDHSDAHFHRELLVAQGAAERVDLAAQLAEPGDHALDVRSVASGLLGFVVERRESLAQRGHLLFEAIEELSNCHAAIVDPFGESSNFLAANGVGAAANFARGRLSDFALSGGLAECGWA